MLRSQPAEEPLVEPCRCSKPGRRLKHAGDGRAQALTAAGCHICEQTPRSCWGCVPQDSYELLGLEVLSIPKGQMLHLPFASSTKCFRALIPVAGTNVCALHPFMSPGSEPGLRCNEELRTPGNLKRCFYHLHNFLGKLGRFYEGRRRAQRGESCVQGKVQKAGWRSSAAGGERSVFTQAVPGCVWLLCHRDLAAESLVQWPDCKTQAANRKTSPGLVLTITQHRKECPTLP